MSRRLVEVASVQFQVESRQANATMQALQQKAVDLNTEIGKTQAEIKNLGNVPIDDKEFVRLDNLLRKLKSDLNDVKTTMKDYTRGVKAADQLLMAYDRGNIEGLSMKAIKAGQNGLRKRIENIDPDKANAEELKSYRIIQEVIRESQRVVDDFKLDAEKAIQTIKDGGVVSEKTLRQTRDGLRDLKQSVEEGTKEWQTYDNQLTMVSDKLQALGVEEARRTGKQTLGRAFRGDFATADVKTIEQIIARLKEYQSVIEDPGGKGARIFAATEKQIQSLSEQLSIIKGDIVNVEQALQVAGQSGASVETMGQAVKVLDDAMRKSTDATKIDEYSRAIDTLTQKIKESTGEWMSLADAEALASKAGGDGFFATQQQMTQAVQAIEREREALVKTIQQKQRNGDVTKQEEDELRRLEKVLGDLKFEQDNFNMSHKQMNDLLKEPKSAEDLDQLKAAIKRADGELHRMKQSLGEGNKEYQKFAKEVKNAKNVLKEMEGQAKATSSAFDKAWSRLKTYVGLYVGAAVAMQKLTATMGDLMELSDKMGEVRKTTGFTADEVGRLTTSLKKLDTRTSIVGLLDLSAAAGQLGLKTQEDVEGFTIAANKLMVALPEMGREGATEMLKVALATGEIDKIRRQMEEGLIDGSSATAVAMEKVGSTIDRLRATSAATAPAITDFVKRVGAVGAQSGITIDQVAALGSTVDALGMRVEMSATALSRMIPAIRNNAYSIGAMIGQTEEEIIRKFDNGMGMDVILDIFETIRNNSRAMTGDVEQDAGEIEKMFERAGLQDIMKELNQMGARAGIVFAGLSQNVDELRRQLGVAAEAYEENIAIEQEYQKMNDTTAAKWERLKNQLEEAFVGDTAQRWLGGIIDGLRKFIDLLTGEGGVSDAFRTILVYIAAVRLGLAEGIVKALTSVWTGIKNIGVALGIVKGQMQAMNYANIFMAIGAAVLYATKCFGLLGKEVSFADRELAKADKEIANATERLDRMFTRLDNLSTAVRRATEETQHLEEGSKELATAEEKAALSTEARKKTIDAINNAYGQYLGFMLTENDRAELIAAAHDKITAALKREMYARQQQQSMADIEQKYQPKILDEWANVRQEMREKGVDGSIISELFENVQTIIDATKFDPNKGTFYIEGAQYTNLQEALGEQVMNSLDGFDQMIATYMYKQLAARTQLTIEELQDITGMVGLKPSDRGNIYAGADATMYMTRGEMGDNNVRQGLMDIYTEFIQKRDEVSDIFNNSIGRWAGKERKKALTVVDELKKKAEAQLNTISTSTDQTAINNAYQELAQALLGLDNQLKVLDATVDLAVIDSVKALADKANQSTDATKLTEARATALSIFARATANNNNNNNNSNRDPNNPRGPYGNYDKRVDPYEQWDANALVKRREEMLERVRALAGGADVQQVLSMDKRFIDEATRKGIRNMRDAIAWYNEERLKIQEELHNRNLTNEGQWMDPRSGGSKRKPKTPESEEAIAELDRYYLERKERIEEARANEEMTEAEYNRRLDALEQEHLERRSALRQTFTSEDKQFIQQFRQWWASVAELDEVSWETIEAEWIAAFERDRKYNNREAQKDLTAMKAITVKQLREIEAIIDKERPFNGITRNLQDNLTKMGILFKDGVDDSDFMEQNTKRLTFLLREAEDAYNMTWEQLERDMRENGLGAWADAIVGSDNAEKEKRAVIAQLHEVYDAVQEAIKKEASLVKKQVDITWNDALLPNGKSIKQTYEAAISQLGVQQGSVSRANSLIGAGTASARVADRLAIRQMQIQLQMQEHYYNLVRQTGMQRIADLREQARQLREQGELDKAARLDLDAQHATMSLNLSLSKEQTELDKQREEIIARTEESQNRLYTSLREWAELLSSSVQSLFEASHAGDAEYYNELAKLNLTGKGGPGAGTYVVIDDAGTSDAKAHYEYLDERQALERQREIERENAQAEAWRKVMDDLNAKMNEQITDWMNAALQNTSINANTDATLQNTEALAGLTNAIAASSGANAVGAAGASSTATPVAAGEGALSTAEVQEWTDALGTEPWLVWEQAGVSAMQHVQQATADTSKRMQTSTQSAFAKMTQAANLYGIAYSAMSNDNLSTTQKFQMMAVQAAGQAAISMLTADLAAGEAKNSVQLPGILGKLLGEMPFPAAMATFAIVTGLLGGLMGLAVSKITKSKSQIAQATGASGANAGKLTTGMLTYAEGNVNEFTDPASLTPGRQYNVDGADGKTYRARYMGKGAKTHITNGPEFHLVGEAGREAIIDAKTTRQIQMDEPGIWQAIKTLYRGGRLSPVRRRGMAAFADGNIDEQEEMGADGIAAYGTGGAGGMSPEQMAAFQSSLDRNNELLERALTEGIKGVFDVHGAHGLVNTYDTAKKEALRHGERYT